MRSARRLVRSLAVLAVAAVALVALGTLGCGGSDDFLQEGILVRLEGTASPQKMETFNVDPIFGNMSPLTANPTAGSGWAASRLLLDAAPTPDGSLTMLYGTVGFASFGVQSLLVDFVAGTLTPSGAPTLLAPLSHLGKLVPDGDVLWALEKGDPGCTGFEALSAGSLARLAGSPATTPFLYIGGQAVAEGGHLYLVGQDADHLVLMHYTAGAGGLALESTLDLTLPGPPTRLLYPDTAGPVRLARYGDRLLVVAFYDSGADLAQGVRLDPTTGHPSLASGSVLTLGTASGPAGSLVACEGWFYVSSGLQLHCFGFGGASPVKADGYPTDFGGTAANVVPVLTFHDLLYFITTHAAAAATLDSAKVHPADGALLLAYSLPYNSFRIESLHRTGQVLFKPDAAGLIEVVRTDLVAGTLEHVGDYTSSGSPGVPQVLRVVLKP